MALCREIICDHPKFLYTLHAIMYGHNESGTGQETTNICSVELVWETCLMTITELSASEQSNTTFYNVAEKCFSGLQWPFNFVETGYSCFQVQGAYT